MKYYEAIQSIKAHDIALVNDGNLSRFTDVVVMSHDDGSYMHLDGAYAYEVIEHDTNDNWLLIASEHHGYFAYNLEDVIRWEQFHRT